MDNFNWNNAFPNPPKSFKDKVSATLNSLPDQKEKDEMENKKVYKKISFKKKVIIVLAAAMIAGTTVFAAGKIYSITSNSSNIPTYTTMPSAEKVKNDLKFSPKLIGKFDNGYTFANGYVVNNEGSDEKGNSVKKTKSLDFSYKKGKDELSLSMENGKLSERSKKETVVATFNGIDLYYHSYANKLEPGDYKLTEQDKKDEASGKYVFSYGADKEKISQVQYLSWIQDGISYSLLGIDSNVSKDELVKMAQQVINTK